MNGEVSLRPMWTSVIFINNWTTRPERGGGIGEGGWERRRKCLFGLQRLSKKKHWMRLWNTHSNTHLYLFCLIQSVNINRSLKKTTEHKLFNTDSTLPELHSFFLSTLPLHPSSPSYWFIPPIHTSDPYLRFTLPHPNLLIQTTSSSFTPLSPTQNNSQQTNALKCPRTPNPTSSPSQSSSPPTLLFLLSSK